MRLRIEHRTSYTYDTPVERGVQMARLWPASHANLSVMNWTVRAEGARVGRSFVDGFGNRCALIDLNAGAVRADILVSGEVETRDSAGQIVGASEQLPPSFYLRTTALTEADEAITTLARSAEGEGRDRLVSLMNLVRDRIEFQIGTTNVTVTAAEALRQGQGVCQDHTHVYCAAARLIGIPARYVSGYLFTGEASSPATHAWVEAHDGEGWIGLDAANRLLSNDYYVRLATGLDYRDAAPVVGTRLGGGTETLNVEVGVSAQQ